MDTNPPTNERIGLAITPPWGLVNKPGISGRPFLAGDGVISGVTKSQGTAASRTVEIYDLETMELVKIIDSNSSGVWSANNLPKNRLLRIIVIGETGERDVTIKIEAE